MKRRKLYGLILFALLVMAVPLAIAKGPGPNGAGITGNMIRVNSEIDNNNEIGDDYKEDDYNKGSVDENNIDEEDDSEDGSRWNPRSDNIEDIDECLQEMRKRNPSADDARMRNACIVALKTQGVNDRINGIKEKFEEKRAEIANKIMEKREEQNRNVRNVILKEFAKKREIVKVKLQEAEQRFQKAKESYQNNKEKHEQARNEFLEMKQIYQQCLAGNNSNETNANCLEYENRLLEKAKEDLLALGDRLIDHLDKVKSRLEGAENINETEAEASIARIDELIGLLEDAKELVEEADSKEELQEASEKIREIWNSIDFDVFNFAERVINSRVGEIYARSRALESQLGKVLERLEAKGINTADFINLTESFREHLDNAKDYMDEANEKFAEAKDVRGSNITNSTKEAKALLEEGKQLTRDAHDELKEAHEVLMDLVRMINQKGENFDPDEINDDDEVEISEPEEE